MSAAPRSRTALRSGPVEDSAAEGEQGDLEGQPMTVAVFNALACGSFVSYFGRLRVAPPVLVDWALGQIARDEEDDSMWPDQLAKAVLSRAPRERVKPAALAALG